MKVPYTKMIKIAGGIDLEEVKEIKSRLCRNRLKVTEKRLVVAIGEGNGRVGRNR